MHFTQNDIAVVGIGCRFPDAGTYEEFWENLIGGKISVKEIPSQRWNIDDYYSSNMLEPNKTVSRWCGILDQIEYFDNQFFNISPREASRMDPQQRLLLEEAWHCIEDSGLPLSELQKKKTGVFVGVQAIDYLQTTAQHDIPIDNYSILGNYECVLANRISHLFGFKGKSMSLDAACASSLYAVNEARHSLISGEIDYALAGGVCLLFHPMQYLALSKGRMLSSDGRCKSFDCDADGFVPGEGVGLLLLQRLPDAKATRSHIYGIIKGSAANHNGATNSMTAPGVDSQRDVILQAYQEAGISPEFTTYLETHGVGSFLSDTTEVEALHQAFQKFAAIPKKCKIGALKGNIGHLEAAAGVSGIIKVLMMMRHRRIPPTLNLQTFNPLINFDEIPFEIVTENCEWKAKGNEHEPLRAGVSAFGFAGSNGHVILEAYSQNPRQNSIHRQCVPNDNLTGSRLMPRNRSHFRNPGGGLIALSAKSPEALEAQVKSWASFTKSKTFENSSLLDICGTLLAGRKHFAYRFGCYVDQKEQIASSIIEKSLNSEKTSNDETCRTILVIGDMKKDSRPGSAELFFPNNCFSTLTSKIYRYLQTLRKSVTRDDLDKWCQGFISGYSLGKTMIDLGFNPGIITGEGDGFLTALAISGMLDPADAHSVASGKMDVINLRRPCLPFYDPVNRAIMLPHVFDAPYLNHLLDLNAIQENKFRRYLRTARILADRQLIFQNFLHEWNLVLRQADLDFEKLLKDDSLFETGTDDCRRKLFLLLVIIGCSLKKLRRKWELPEYSALNILKIDELSSLLVDRILTKDELVELILNPGTDVSAIAHRCNERQHLLDPQKPYVLLKKNCETLNEIPDPKAWIKKGTTADISEIKAKSSQLFVIGRICAKLMDHEPQLYNLDRYDDKSVKQALLYLWISGVDIQWQKLYPTGSFNSIALPLYPFQRRPFWLSPLQKNDPANNNLEPTEEKVSHALPLQTVGDQIEVGDMAQEKEPVDVLQNKMEKLISGICMQLLDVSAEELDLDMPFDAYGVDSVIMMEFLDRLENSLGITVQPDALSEYSTIRKLALFLVEDQSATIGNKKLNGAAFSILKENSARNQAHNNISVKNPEIPDGGRANAVTTEMNRSIAVIGMACRFPKSPNLDSYWQNIESGQFLISEVPTSRWEIADFYSPDKKAPNKTYCKWGGFIEGLELFDAGFFNIPEDDALIIDPQHRILLELTQHVLDNAGFTKDEVSNAKIGVYIGGNESTYINHYWHRIPNHLMKRLSVSRISNMMAARVSDYFNFKSASQTLDTACSSSLVAIHRACEHIRTGECELAIAGGIELLLDPRTYIEFSKGSMLSDDGKVYVFDKKANGFVPGEGAGLVLLKSYTRALKDGDNIYAVILGSAVNNDGHTLGVTVPNLNGQAEVITSALQRSGISPDTISYYEAHGTGTLLGDPIEIKAATEVYREYTTEKQYCAVGSVKSNMGHLIRAAGVASFIKVAMGLRHQKIPPTLNCSDLHPRFRFDESPFYAITRSEAWRPRGGFRRAALSSFGFGGTNCHMIMQEFDPAAADQYVRKRKSFDLTRFQHKRFWLGDGVKPAVGVHNQINEAEAPPDDGVTRTLLPEEKADVMQNTGFTKEFVYGDAILRDHSVFGVQTLLGAVHSSLAIQAAGKKFPGRKIRGLRKVTFFEALKVLPMQRYHVTVNFVSRDGKMLFENRYKRVAPSESEVSHVSASGEIVLDMFRSGDENTVHDDVVIANDLGLMQFMQSASLTVPGEKFYSRQTTYGESLFSIRKVYFGDDHVLSHIVPTSTMRSDFGHFIVNPAIFDAGHITVLYAAARIDEIDHQPFIPLYINEIVLGDINESSFEECYCRVRITKQTDEMAHADMRYYDKNGKCVMAVTGYCSRRVSSPQAMGIDNAKARPSVQVADVKQSGFDFDSSLQRQDFQSSAGLKKEIEDYIIDKLRNTMENSPDDFPLDRNFLDLGLESNDLIRLTPVIEEEVGIEIYPTLFFEHQNIRELAAFFIDEHKDSFERHLEKERSTSPPQTGESLRTAGMDISLPFQSASTGMTDTRNSTHPHIVPILNSPTSSSADIRSQDIAVVGMAGRFAASDTLDQFWQHIQDGSDLIREIPPDRWDWRQWFDNNPQTPHKTYSKWGSFINDVDKFDAAFFGILPLQATWMDPQQRILLETMYACIEDAGLGQEIYGTNTGLYHGICFHDYGNEIVRSGIPIVDYQYNSTIYSITTGFISYNFDLQGPCIPLDNACASSLTALHLACKALHSEECDMAFVAGTNLLLSPLHYVHFSRVQALSPTGRCRAFDRSADGYVPGEGIGVLLLKPLQKAIADGNNIHAVIKGTAINHVGRSNNPTAPRPELQTRLLLKAWQIAGINPETITYLETHGTGTKLGDPVEINAIIKAFKSHTDKKHFCTLGSTKTNIGHLEGAAGVASLIKVILAMKHRSIPVMPTFKNLNPYIKLENSALRINTAPEPWETAEGIPRRAGISSFGMTGNNAHVVIEEYIDKNVNQIRLATSTQHPAIIVLSAKDKDRLAKLARQLLANIKDKQLTDENLHEMAYTLQVGRGAMEDRLSVIAESLKELEEKLSAFIDGKDEIDGLYHGRLADSNQITESSASSEEFQQTIDGWHQTAKLSKLADLWVKGLNVDWNRLYGDIKPRRISLPAYPFRRQSYWLPKNESPPASVSNDYSTASALIQPLIHQNPSQSNEMLFGSLFTGREFFLENHIIKGKKVLPGVVHIEMARAVLDHIPEMHHEQGFAIRFEKIVWAKPIVVGENSKQVHLTLLSNDSGRMTYEIHSPQEGGGSAPVIYSQGSVCLSRKSEVPPLNIEALQAECNLEHISPDHFYEEVRHSGLDLGPGLQGIEMLFVGAGQVLAKLSLPSSVLDTLDRFVLHPSLMDSMIQTSIGLMMASGVLMGDDDHKLVLPFVVQEIEVLNTFTTSMWAIVRFSAGSTAADKVPKFDLDLCNDRGGLCVRMKGLSVRFLDGHAKSLEKTGTLMLRPFWKEQAIALQNPDKAVVRFDRHMVILCEPEIELKEAIESHLQGVDCITFQAGNEPEDERFQIHAVQLLKIIQGILADKPTVNVLIQVVIFKTARIFSALSGLLQTARLENPKLIGQIIEVSPEQKQESIIGKLKENSQHTDAVSIRYDEGRRWVRAWEEMNASRLDAKVPWKDAGIYLITGGTGGLGRIFTREIAQKARHATLILTGRSPSENKQEQLEALKSWGARIEYRQADVTRKQAVVELIRGIRDEFGSLNGIIHCAGVTRDSFILKKTIEEIRQVLAPKVSGVVYLDQATRDLELDFFVFFSSVAGVLGNFGQADYATANAFMDGYADYRNLLVATHQRHGRTLSINWPLWKEGGMSVDTDTEQSIRRRFGLVAMQSSTGIDALYRGFAVDSDQWMVLEGEIDKMRQKFVSVSEPAAVKTGQAGLTYRSDIGQDGGVLIEKVQSALIRAVSSLQQIRIEDIDLHKPLNAYGFDSIMLNKLTNNLNTALQVELTPTIFFEHPTLHALSEFLVEENRSVLATQFLSPYGSTDATPDEKPNTGEVTPAGVSSVRSTIEISPAASKDGRILPEPIAIVGMSGRFPMAGDLNEFWSNLVQGKDCIEKIPSKRWDWRAMYGNPSREPNKSDIKWGGFIEGIDEFDPLFFGISPREAEFMDPQQRLLMMYVWKAIEDAGYSARSLAGTQTAIFVGTTNSGYSERIARANGDIDGYFSTGLLPSVGPNRMSYFLNIHGPSEPIETACSSSLIAIHRAVEGITLGTFEMAVVGGVNTIVSPEIHISFNKAGMLCQDGRCKTFSNKANGYARGEGVGMLFLKKLTAAEQARDHIYGVIRATAENHGGRANSLTAPNPIAQAELLKTVYTKAAIDPRTVSYIEAHGTGTELGDPIEINALKAAFEQLYRATGDARAVNAHCGLGSVKTNIGHLELAAGVAGVIKVLLQLKHKTLVKSLHCDTLNPFIQLENSPFYIVRDTKPWEELRNSQGLPLPRRAGISSFGFGGANAHVLIEEYIPKDPMPPEINFNSQNPAIIILSAVNEDRIKAQIRQLLDTMRSQKLTDSDLPDMAYTLQVGREALKERLAVIVSSTKDLDEKLQAFLSGQDGIEDLYHGKVRPNDETLALFAADEDTAKMIDAWILKRKFRKLLALWVRGLQFDWNKLYADSKPRRISLPTYPFAKQRFWVPEPAPVPDGLGRSSESWIHPLIQKNTSHLSQTQFSSTFTGHEFFLEDHRVAGQRVMPGVAYLEMARAAVEYAADPSNGDNAGIRLKNVVWTKPIAVSDQDVQVHVRLFPEGQGKMAYEIYSNSQQDPADILIHSQGSAESSPAAPPPPLDLAALQAHCNLGSISSGQCYETFKTMGIEYGPGHRGVAAVHLGPHQVLARITLPAAVSDTMDQFSLHPSLMDSALQASIGLIIGFDDPSPTGRSRPSRPNLPFALGELELFAPCVSQMWAHCRFSNGDGTGKKVHKFDIDVCDDQGKICVRMKDFTTRELAGDVNPMGVLMFSPCWNEQTVARQASVPTFSRHLVLLCDLGEVSWEERIASRLNGARCLALQSQNKDIDKKFEDHAYYLLKKIQGIFADRSAHQVFIQIVVPDADDRQLLSSLSGMLHTAGLENPNLIGQLIEVDPNKDFEAIFEILEQNSCRPLDRRIRYQADKRLVADWTEIEVSHDGPDIPWKSGGVYLITGGAGGLGLIFAKDIAQQATDVNLILTGRSPLNKEKEDQLEELRKSGAGIKYAQADVTQKNQVSALINSIREEFGSLHGIIHAAGVIRDSFIIKKTKEELLATLSPKVSGLVHLDEESKDLPLDFFVLFSSIAGSLGNMGQSDYSCANAFMDNYAAYRNRLVASGKRQGKTLSINWPLWEKGGMRVSAETERMMRQRTGMIAMKTSSGIRCLYQALAGESDQVMVMEGLLARMRQKIQPPPRLNAEINAVRSSSASSGTANTDTTDLLEKIKTLLTHRISRHLKVDPEDIDEDIELTEYGFDSIMVTEFTTQLNEEYKLELTPVIFFEQSTTLNSFAQYLAREYEPEFAAQFPVQSADSMMNAKVIAKEAEENAQAKNISVERAVTDVSSRSTTFSCTTIPIAIVGMSGRFPKAADLNEFWHNLAQGKDCIELIPKDRWDWEEFYGDPKKEKNKTYSKWGGFIKDIDKFDASFFKLSPREAALMEPQQRIFLETVWHCIEDAGYRAATLSGTKTGLFVGAASMDYFEIESRLATDVQAHTITGVSLSILANRISYILNLRGPSEPIDTACSSALVAIDRAIGCLRTGACDMAIAGGVNVLLTPTLFISFSKAGMLSKDGRCRAFDRRANGYVRGEGAGAIFLKPLDKALADGDHIYAIIKGSATNHSGRGSSLTAPNSQAQAELLIETYQKAGVDPSTVTYIEAHGTGTELGDPIEINGLKLAFAHLYKAYGLNMPDQPHCGLGSVKTNIGHLETAAGIAGIIKVLKAMQHATIPASLHCNEINPYIDLNNTPFYIATRTRTWERLRDKEGRPQPLRAGVNSFGFGGVNAHVILEEFLPETEATDSVGPISLAHSLKEDNQFSASSKDREQPLILVLSAHSEERLQIYAGKMLDYILRHFGSSESDDTMTSSEEPDGRSHLHVNQSADNRYDSRSGALPQDAADDMKEAVAEAVRQMVGRILDIDIDEIDTACDISDLGFDVVHLNMLCEMMDTQFKLQLSPKEFSINDSIDELAGRLLVELGCEIADNDPGLEESSLSGAKFLPDIIYTLQVGREPLPVRFAAVIKDYKEMISVLNALHRGATSGDNIHHGTVRKAKSKTKRNMQVQGHGEPLDKLWANGEVNRIATLWVSGVPIDWESFYSTEKPHRISLPTYPFSKERFWLPLESDRLSTGWAAYQCNDEELESRVLHPLIGENISTNKRLCFRSYFTGKEFFLRDHRLMDKPVLPGVAYAEMARAAAFLSDTGPIHVIRNLSWLNPLVVNESATAEIQLVPKDGGISYKVVLFDGSDQRVCGQGKLMHLQSLGPRQKGTDQGASQTDIRVEESDTLALRDALRMELKKCDFLDGTAGKVVIDKNNEIFLDLAGIERRCPHNLASDNCYDKFTSFGLHYGESFRSLKNLHCGKMEAFSQIRINSAIKNKNNGWDQFVLHPSAMDAALHTVLGALDHEPNDLRHNPYVPYFLGQLTFTGPLPEMTYAFVRFADASPETKKNTPREIQCHIIIADKAGRILVIMRDLVLREMLSQTLIHQNDTRSLKQRQNSAPKEETADKASVSYYSYTWDHSNSAIKRPALDQDDDWPVLLFDANDILYNELRSRLQINNETHRSLILVSPGPSFSEVSDDHFIINPSKPDHYDQLLERLQINGDAPGTVLHLWSLHAHRPENGALAEMLETSIYSLFYLTQSMLRQNKNLRKRKNCRFHYWFASEKEQGIPLFSAVGGFALTATREYPRYNYRTFGLDGFSDKDRNDRLPKLLLDELGTDDCSEILYRGDERYVRRINLITPPLKKENGDSLPTDNAPKSDFTLPLNDGGVYLITGGSGKLGMIMARAFARAAKVRLALVGRSEPGEKTMLLINELKKLGTQARYFKGDISKADDAKALISEVQSSYGKINGIVHAAGIIHDSTIARKNKKEIDDVLAPKLYGSLNLDAETKDLDLDFFVLFSSVAAVAGNPGQSDYAYANRFMDIFAENREQQVEKGLRHGKTISINWPFWRDGGMRIDKETEEMQRTIMGAVPLETQPGVKAFWTIMALDLPRVLVLSGDRRKLENNISFIWTSPDDENQRNTEYSEASSHVSLSSENNDQISFNSAVESETASSQHIEIDSKIHSLLVKDLQTKAAEILEADGALIDADEYMQDFGFESVTLAEFASSINDTYDLSLTPAIFFNLDEPTLDCLARYLETEHYSAMESYYSQVTGTLDIEDTTAILEGVSPDEESDETDNAVRTDQAGIQMMEPNKCATAISDSSRHHTKALHPFFNEIYTHDEISGQTSYEILSHWNLVHPVFSHHLVLGKSRMPGVGYVEMLYAASRCSLGSRFNQIDKLLFLHPIVIDEVNKKETRIYLRPEKDVFLAEIKTFEGINQSAGRHPKENINATAVLQHVPLSEKQIDMESLKMEYSQKVKYSYDFLLRDELGFHIGAYYNSIRNVYISKNEQKCSALVEIRISSIAGSLKDNFFLHPGMLDPCAYAAIALINDRNLQDAVSSLYLPVCFEKVRVYGEIGEECFCLIEAKKGPKADSVIPVDISCFNLNGEVQLEMLNVQFKRIDGAKN